VSVADNGCGLPADAEDELFQPFFTTKKSGMGMGLSISRSIVAAHGGRLWFSRNPQRGATFFFTIPAYPRG
jgi:signal transduction histidine kinase